MYVPAELHCVARGGRAAKARFEHLQKLVELYK